MSSLFFPENLKALPIWVLWKLEERDGRSTKVPYSGLFEGRASSTNPETWTTFSVAFAKYESRSDEFSGIGIVISKEYRIVFIDVDHAITEDGSFDQRAEDVLSALPDTYSEISQSGTGLHVLALGEIPRSFKNSQINVEMYDSGRFCAMTGNALNASELHENPSGLAHVFEVYSTPEKIRKTHTRAPEALQRSDQWIVAKAQERGGRFPDLYSGNWEKEYSSRSEADLALCMILAFWADADESVIDRIFRSSGLYRDKWEREDYRSRTIEEACNRIEETYSEYVSRIRREEGADLERAFLSQW